MKPLKNFANNLLNINSINVSPIKILTKIVTTLPESRDDLELNDSYTDLKISYSKLHLSAVESNLGSIIVKKNQYDKLVNESPHLLFLAKQSNSICYFLSDLNEVNPEYYKTGDIIIPSLNQKYEAKTIKTLSMNKLHKLIYQYKKNDFSNNDMHFSICFGNIR